MYIMLTLLCNDISMLAFYTYLWLYRWRYFCAATSQYLTIW